jgi:hypothetical protein
VLVLRCPLRFPYKDFVQLYVKGWGRGGGHGFIYVICVCLGIVVSNTYCVVFLLCFSSSYVAYVASFSGLSIYDGPFGIL